jgi:hypothetical protein
MLEHTTFLEGNKLPFSFRGDIIVAGDPETAGFRPSLIFTAHTNSPL